VYFAMLVFLYFSYSKLSFCAFHSYFDTYTFNIFFYLLIKTLGRIYASIGFDLSLQVMWNTISK
jgi:hypothetical protein